MGTTHDPQMLRGVLTLLLLQVLAQDDGYGYGIVTRLQDTGFPDLTEGTVYPALTRLENAGALTSYLRRSGQGPARKYYRLTDDGRQQLSRARAAWDDLVTSVARATSSLVPPHGDTS